MNGAGIQFPIDDFGDGVRAGFREMEIIVKILRLLRQLTLKVDALQAMLATNRPGHVIVGIEHHHHRFRPVPLNARVVRPLICRRDPASVELGNFLIGHLCLP